jgi:hypothetical protein
MVSELFLLLSQGNCSVFYILTFMPRHTTKTAELCSTEFEPSYPDFKNLPHLVSVILIETGLAEISQQAHHCHNLVHPGLSETLKPLTLCFTWPHTTTSLGEADGGFRT